MKMENSEKPDTLSPYVPKRINELNNFVAVI